MGWADFLFDVNVKVNKVIIQNIGLIHARCLSSGSECTSVTNALQNGLDA